MGMFDTIAKVHIPVPGVSECPSGPYQTKCLRRDLDRLEILADGSIVLVGSDSDGGSTLPEPKPFIWHGWIHFYYGPDGHTEYMAEVCDGLCTRICTLADWSEWRDSLYE